MPTAPSFVEFHEMAPLTLRAGTGLAALILPPRRVAAETLSPSNGSPIQSQGILPEHVPVLVKRTLAMLPMALGPTALLFSLPGKLLLPTLL